MSLILTTASGNFDNKKSWAGIKKHLKHDPKLNHKNKYLNTAESKQLRKYNKHTVLINYSKFCETNFSPYVKDHDAHIKDKHKRFKSVKRFLEVDNEGKTRKLQPAQLYTEKFSDEQSYKKILKLLFNTIKKQFPSYSDEQVKDRAYRIINVGLMQYASGFNARNPNVNMFEYYTHMDEKGAPHLHSLVMPFVKPSGTTKKGRLKKPSWSLNRALGVQYHNVGKSKENLKRFRKQEDAALIDAMNYVLERTCDLKKPAFKLIRKTDKDPSLETGVAHDIYKAKQQKLDEIKAQLQAKQKALKLATEATKKIQARKKAIEEQNKKIMQQQAKRDKALKARELDLNALELGGMDSRGNHHVGLEQHREALKARESRLNAWAKDLKAKESGGYDSKGILHKGIQERVEEGIKAGVKKVLHPLKAFKHAYLNCLIHQQLKGDVDESQIHVIVEQQEGIYGKAAMTAALSGVSGKEVQRQAVKAVGVGTLAMAKDLPRYNEVSEAVRYAVQSQEKEDKQRKVKDAKDAKDAKDITDF